MDREKKNVWILLGLIVLFFLGFSLSVNLPVVHKNFLTADQAVYFSLTQSLAHDFDLEYTRQDLVRYYREFEAGPQGIFLKRGPGGKIYYAKSWAYALLAAPFVRVFGPNGFLVFHTLLLALLLAMGYRYAAALSRPWPALLAALTFLFASAAGVYFFWLTPDFFNLTLVFTVIFLWLYKTLPREQPCGCCGPAPSVGRLERLLRSDASDIAAALLIGVAVFSKPPNVVLLAPLVLANLVRRKFLKSLLLVLCFLLVMGVLFGANYLFTGDWNYQGGERKSFIGTFPLEKEEVTFDSTGHTMTAKGYLEKVKLFPAWLVLPNLYWYFFGRFMGLAWYFFPALLFLVLFFGRRRDLKAWLLLGAIAVEILIYIVLMPDNYGGGGGTLANRYFLNIYPLFFFLPPVRRRGREIALCWAMAAVFLSQILLNPFGASHAPASHAKRLPFKLIPVELSQVNEFPTNTNPFAFRVPTGEPPQDGYLHFLDDNFYPKHPTENGVWTRGGKPAEIILKTYFPVKTIAVHLLNNPRIKNDITVRIEGRAQTISLGEKQRATLEFPAGRGFVIRAIHLYKITVQASKSAMPYFELKTSSERRNLGVFFSLELIPR
ncbi:MAG: hypothetical protein A2Y69_09320 [Candidatus Aminicenantes bacterium RBG_13_59_9]|nr:MAG: hypothetical protein A2Y69_09320 [Candidatus Aminicenantes bacterium RBG_13_59_9]